MCLLNKDKSMQKWNRFLKFENSFRDIESQSLFTNFYGHALNKYLSESNRNMIIAIHICLCYESEKKLLLTFTKQMFIVRIKLWLLFKKINSSGWSGDCLLETLSKDGCWSKYSDPALQVTYQFFVKLKIKSNRNSNRFDLGWR